MKNLLIVSMLLFAVACSQTEVQETDANIQGRPANVYSEAYRDMCKREPNSPLCKKD